RSASLSESANAWAPIRATARAKTTLRMLTSVPAKAAISELGNVGDGGLRRGVVEALADGFERRLEDAQRVLGLARLGARPLHSQLRQVVVECLPENRALVIGQGE